MALDKQRGLTIIELLISLTIGLVILSALTSFLWRTTKTMEIGRQQAEALSRGQLAMTKMVKLLKEANTEPPPLFAFTPAWNQLPGLPYMAGELQPYPVTSGIAMEPTTPAARKFSAQMSFSDKDHKWYPNPDKDLSESNSLVFYYAPQPGIGNASQVQRITFRLETLASGKSRIVKEIQNPLVSASTNFHSSPTPVTQVIATDVNSVQFTYPLLANRLNQPSPSGSDFHTFLNNMETTQGNVVLQGYLNQNFRKVIGIRLEMAGANLKAKTMKGIELTTEVRLRNE